MPIVDISILSIIIRPLIGSTYEQLRERLKTCFKSTHKSKNAHGQRRFSTPYLEEVKHEIDVQIQIKDEPVRPKRPTRSPAFKVNDTSCSTAGRSGAYLIIRFFTIRESIRWDAMRLSQQEVLVVNQGLKYADSEYEHADGIKWLTIL